jgi:hypothetical protein
MLLIKSAKLPELSSEPVRLSFVAASFAASRE